MNKILFLTCRNIINTCGELRLVKNRAEVLFHNYDIATDFMVFTHKDTVSPEKIDAGGELIEYKYNIFNLIQKKAVFNTYRNDIKQRLKKTKYDIVVISGSPILELVDDVREIDKSILIFADIHGAYEELLEFRGSNVLITFARHLMYKKTKKLERLYLPTVDYLFAVSNGLKSYLIREYGISEDKIHVVPCSVNKTILDYDEYSKDRLMSRKKYGIENEMLFIYSGGVSEWQCIRETVEIYKYIKDRINYPSKLLLLSGNKEYISQFESDSIIVDSLKASEVSHTLPAGDFAFLLRKDYITNHVAYPNKYLEYIKAGLNVITTCFVEDIAESVKSNNLGYVLSDSCVESPLIDYLNKTQERKIDFTERQELLDDVCFENRLLFVKKLLMEKS